MSQTPSPFNPKVVLAMLAVGAAAFLLFLYALGAGWTANDRSSGSGHAASKAINGYAGLYSLLEKRGYDVSLTRNRGELDTDALLVVTPQHFTDPDELADLIEDRRLVGPTLLILPKWYGIDAGRVSSVEGAKRGWVLLIGAESPEWVGEIGIGDLEADVVEEARWRAGGRSGAMPEPKEVQTLKAPGFDAIVRAGDGNLLAAYRDDGGYYPELEEWADRTPRAPEALAEARRQIMLIEAGDPVPSPEDEESYNPADDYWPLVIVADPDLLNNSGLADAERARLALDIVDATIGDYDLPVVFDLTMAGFGAQKNLLTLAFEPPFLAATLTLLLAALVIGWRGFIRFGPPRAAVARTVGGKTQLARDGARLIERARRFSLVGPPYGELVARRIARRLGLPARLPRDARSGAIARALERRGEGRDAFPQAMEDMRQATRPAELVRAARALQSIERMLRQ